MLIFLVNLPPWGCQSEVGQSLKGSASLLEGPQPSPCLMTEGTGFLFLSQSEKSHRGRSSCHGEGCTAADCWVTELPLHPSNKIMSSMLRCAVKDTLWSSLRNKHSSVYSQSFSLKCLVCALEA